jgi:Ca2+-binding RTX toxin-like protein
VLVSIVGGSVPDAKQTKRTGEDMPTVSEMAVKLESIVVAVTADKGLAKKVSTEDMAAGIAAIRELNLLLAEVIAAQGLNDDGVISADDLARVSKAIQADSALFDRFIAAHGDDEGSNETGFHVLQNDGGASKFHGRALVDTVVDAVFHAGFDIKNGRFVNEDGDQNERVADVAAWLNYFLNGRVYLVGDSGNNELYSGKYSTAVGAGIDETYDAGAGNDKIWADIGNDIVLAGDGNDESGGGAGNDQMYGGAGEDELFGDVGDDILYGDGGDDDLVGGRGNDTLIGGAGPDCLWGQGGNDRLEGGDDADMMGGGKGKDITYGGGGDDQIFDESGADFIDAGDGNDKVGGGKGADTLLGGAGDDEIWDDHGKDVIDGGDGNDTLGGGRGFNIVDGGAGNDKIYGGRAGEVLRGGDGNDEVHGDQGADRLEGGAGNDDLNGGEGADILIGGSGADELCLWDDSNSADILVFNVGDTGTVVGGIDIVEGFVAGEDKIDLKAFGQMTLSVVDFSSTGPSMYYDGKMLRIDSDADRVADAIIEFKWVDSLKIGDFLLA